MRLRLRKLEEDLCPGSKRQDGGSARDLHRNRHRQEEPRHQRRRRARGHCRRVVQAQQHRRRVREAPQEAQEGRRDSRQHPRRHGGHGALLGGPVRLPDLPRLRDRGDQPHPDGRVPRRVDGAQGQDRRHRRRADRRPSTPPPRSATRRPRSCATWRATGSRSWSAPPP